jgi:hypothetical protein
LDQGDPSLTRNTDALRSGSLRKSRADSKPLGDHLAKNVQIGSVFWYRRPGVSWDIGLAPVVPAPATVATPVPPGNAVALVIDLPNQRVTFRGTEIRTSPPDHLQSQSILALAALAQRAGEALTMAGVADGIWKLGGLARKPTSPDQKDLKYKLMTPLKKALPNGAVKNLIEAVRGTGLRLNLRPEAVRLVLREGSGGEKP